MRSQELWRLIHVIEAGSVVIDASLARRMFNGAAVKDGGDGPIAVEYPPIPPARLSDLRGIHVVVMEELHDLLAAMRAEWDLMMVLVRVALRPDDIDTDQLSYVVRRELHRIDYDLHRRGSRVRALQSLGLLQEGDDESSLMFGRYQREVIEQMIYGVGPRDLAERLRELLHYSAFRGPGMRVGGPWEDYRLELRRPRPTPKTRKGSKRPG